jgi:hypothetical protein
MKTHTEIGPVTIIYKSKVYYVRHDMFLNIGALQAYLHMVGPKFTCTAQPDNDCAQVLSSDTDTFLYPNNTGEMYVDHVFDTIADVLLSTDSADEFIDLIMN